MFITITFIFLYTICTKSPLQNNINLRADCYRSFSDPVIFIKLLHYYPSGPFALSAVFICKSYFYFGSYTSKTVIGQYDFSRYDFPCNTSTIFTTGGFLFSYMDININIYLFREDNIVSYIHYIFNRGFKPGEYKLLDFDQIFAVQLKILDTREKYLETQKKLKEVFKLYIKSISATEGELCIVTDNNRAAIVKLKKRPFLLAGYISDLSVYDYQGIIGQKNVRYPAFLCQTYGKYYEETVIFIIDKNTFRKRFYISFITDYTKDVPDFEKLEIEIDHPNYESIDKLDKIPSKYNKIFIFKYYIGPIYKNCSDGSQAATFFSRDHFGLFAVVVKDVDISTSIKVYARFFTSPLDPCGDEE